MRIDIAVPPYTAAIRSALAQQLVVLLVGTLVLDGGDVFRVSLIAFLAFWVAAFAIRLRRGLAPTRFDLLFIHRGYVPLCVLAFLLVHFFWRLRAFQGVL
jgi:hypothetical protein